MITAISVDDEPIVHTMLEEMVKESGLPVNLIGHSLSADDAMQIISTIHPDLLLLDIQMGDTDGLSLANKLSEQTSYSPVIIYITAYDRFDYAREALRLGAHDYILKPIRQPELTAVLKRAINTIQANRVRESENESTKKHLSQVLPSLAVDSQPSMQTRSSSIAHTVREYIDSTYMDNVSLSTAAETLNLSPGYIGGVFKAEIGITFRAYLRSVRITRAKLLMTDPGLNISQIALAVGYDDLNYFSEAFLAETGMRPSEYRGGGKHWAK